MAARLVVAVAFIALSHSSPVLINGSNRDQRAFSFGQSYSSGVGLNQASANADGSKAQAYGSSNGGAPVVRDAFGNYYPGQSVAKAVTYDTQPTVDFELAKAQALNGAYYPVPAPATVVTYNQNFEVPAEVAYVPTGPISAKSVATSDGISESSLSSATTNGAGVAQSTAQTQRGAGFGSTSTNAKTYGGAGSAVSNAKTGYNTAVSDARTQGFGSASSVAQTNEQAILTPVVTPVFAPVITEEVVPAVVAAKQQPYRTVYTPVNYGSASSNANVNGQYGTAASSAKANRRSIRWHFGTAYDTPAAYKTVYAAPVPAYGSANANAAADVNSFGVSSAKTTANSNGFGNANANANANNPGYTVFRSELSPVAVGYGNAKTSANTYGQGSANADANVNPYGSILSTANTSGNGAANSNADLNPTFGAVRYAGNVYRTAQGGKTIANAQSRGTGSANSSAKSHGVNAAYRVVNSAANSSGWGSARADAQSL